MFVPIFMAVVTRWTPDLASIQGNRQYDTIKNLCPDSDGDVYFEQFSSNGVQCPAGFYK